MFLAGDDSEGFKGENKYEKELNRYLCPLEGLSVIASLGGKISRQCLIPV